MSCETVICQAGKYAGKLINNPFRWASAIKQTYDLQGGVSADEIHNYCHDICRRLGYAITAMWFINDDFLGEVMNELGESGVVIIY